MILAIDASNIKAGGGLIHLIKTIENASPFKFNISKIIVVGGNQIRQLPNRIWLEKRIPPMLNSNIWCEIIWKIFFSNSWFQDADVVWSPGGIYYSNKGKYISMSQNMLVFQREERNRFPFTSVSRLRLWILEFLQLRSLKNSLGNIYISKFARDYIHSKHSLLRNKLHSIINLGASDDFKFPVKKQHPIQYYSKDNPIKILYVSIINAYKHHVNTIKAIKFLVQEGQPIEYHIVGPLSYGKKKFLEEISKSSEFVNYHGQVPHHDISSLYKNADIFLFASSCENMPNILIEAMSAGLPIACSNMGPMPEFLQDAGVYFNPLDINSIENALRIMINNHRLREECANKAKIYANNYSWVKCSDESLKFISNCFYKNTTM